MMKKTLAISHTVYPEYEERSYWFGAMPQHKFMAMDSQLFNRWALYIHKENLKLKGFKYNKPKAGGAGFEDAQEAVLRMAKEILK